MHKKTKICMYTYIPLIITNLMKDFNMSTQTGGPVIPITVYRMMKNRVWDCGS